VQSGAGIDPLNPQGTEVSFLLSAVAVGVLQSFFKGVFGYSVDVFTSAEVTFGLLEHLFTAGSGSNCIY
jgi:hypothetical protein